MNGTNFSLCHHLDELHQVAADLRASRTIQASRPDRGPGRIRLAVGRALLSLGSVLVAAPRQRSVTAS